MLTAVVTQGVLLGARGLLQVVEELVEELLTNRWDLGDLVEAELWVRPVGLDLVEADEDEAQWAALPVEEALRQQELLRGRCWPPEGVERVDGAAELEDLGPAVEGFRAGLLVAVLQADVVQVLVGVRFLPDLPRLRTLPSQDEQTTVPLVRFVACVEDLTSKRIATDRVPQWILLELRPVSFGGIPVGNGDDQRTTALRVPGVAGRGADAAGPEGVVGNKGPKPAGTLRWVSQRLWQCQRNLMRTIPTDRDLQ